MKRFFKEFIRFFCVIILICILVTASSYHAYSTSIFFCVGLVALLLLFTLSLIGWKRKKISKAWAIDIGIVALLIYPLFIYLAGLFWSEEYEIMHLVTKYKNNTLIFPIEGVKGLKTYNREDVKLSDDERIAYDKKGNLLTGVVHYSDNELKSDYTRIYKKGKLVYFKDKDNAFNVINIGVYKDKDRYSLMYKNKTDDGFVKFISTKNFHYVGVYKAINKPRLEYIIKGSVHDKDWYRPYIRLYSNEGKVIFERDEWVEDTPMCYLKDGTKRPATEEDIESFLTQEVEVKKNTDYEFTSLCQ